jgi:LCP family protein required for cell wall assembly
MSEWPQGWYRESGDGRRTPSGSNDPTVDVPVGSSRPLPPPPGSRAPGGRPAAREPLASGRPGSAWPDQPPPSSARRGGSLSPAPQPGPYPGGPYPGGQYPGGPGRGGRGGGRGGRGWLRPRRIVGVLAVLIALVLVAAVGEYFNLNGRLHHSDVLVDYSGRPLAASGTNWLIAGSDSRQGLTAAQEKALSTGSDIGGSRSDTILVLHIPSGGGKPLLISLPRDSWVPIPGYGENKLNAAYSYGGAKLLAETVQNATGLRIEHYMEIGFGGFVGVVNSVGGVRMCLEFPLHDTASGLNLNKGCQTLDGAEALAYVRDRHDFAEQDLQREQDQRLLLKALLSKLTSPGVLLNPFALIPAADGTAATLTVDSGTSLRQLASAAFALKDPDTTTVPIATSNYLVDGQDAVEWDRTQALTLFDDLNAGTPVPASLIIGSSQAS